MIDYIKREDALDIVADNNVHGEITLNRYDKIIDGIYEIPSADVEPIRHGRWLYTPTAWAYCSVCGSEPPNESNSITAYCPNCGAKMDGEKNEE